MALVRYNNGNGWSIFKDGVLVASVRYSWSASNDGGFFSRNYGAGSGSVYVKLAADIAADADEAEKSMHQRKWNVSFERSIDDARYKNEFVSDARKVIRAEVDPIIRREFGVSLYRIPVVKTLEEAWERK